MKILREKENDTIHASRLRFLYFARLISIMLARITTMRRTCRKLMASLIDAKHLFIGIK